MIIDHQFHHISDDEKRRRAWIDSLSAFFVTQIHPEVVVPTTAFHRYHHMNQLVFGEIAASPQTIERTPALVAAQNLDHVVLRLYTSGQTNIAIAGQAREITQESFVTFDLSQPILSETKGMTGLNLAVPRRLLEGRVGDVSAWHGQIVPAASSPVTKLLADHLKNVSACLRSSTPAQMSHIVPATTALCNALFLSEADSTYIGAFAFAVYSGTEPQPLPQVQPEISLTDAAVLEAGLAGRTLHLLPVDLGTPEFQAAALQAMPVSEAEGRRLIAQALAGKRPLGRIVVWDNRAEDGDVVRVSSAGLSATIRLTHAPQTIVIPYDPGSSLIVTGIRDADGGGITAAIELATGPLPLPPLRVGETRMLPLF